MQVTFKIKYGFIKRTYVSSQFKDSVSQKIEINQSGLFVGSDSMSSHGIKPNHVYQLIKGLNFNQGDIVYYLLNEVNFVGRLSDNFNKDCTIYSDAEKHVIKDQDDFELIGHLGVRLY
jgi:hypothetical protein